MNHLNWQTGEKYSVDSKLVSQEISGIKKRLQSLQEIASISDRYGSAAECYLSAYDGKTSDGKFLKRSLKSIHQSRVSANPLEAKRNIKQQAGFSAENVEVARRNEELYLKGDPFKKYARMDDLGHTNDELIDITNGTHHFQMKDIGKSGAECFDKLCSDKHQKYFDKNIEVVVPSDFYEDAIRQADARIENIRSQLESPRVKNNPVLLKQKKDELKRVEKMRGLIKPAYHTSSEALEARENPLLFTAKNEGRLIFNASIEGFVSGAVNGATTATISNFSQWLMGNVDLDVALKNVANQSAKSAIHTGAVTGLATGLDSVIKHNKSNLPGILTKNGVPTAAATLIVDCGVSIAQYMKGEISGGECFVQMGKSVSLTLETMALPAQAAFLMTLPLTLVSVSISVLRGAYESAKIARERRIQIEKECAEQIAILKQMRTRIEEQTKLWTDEVVDLFEKSCRGMNKALELENVDSFIGYANEITEFVGGNSQFKNKKEFDNLMNSDESFVL